MSVEEFVEALRAASPTARAIVIGADRGEQLSIHVTRREFPEASDYWDGNRVYATIRIRAGAFRGEYDVLLRTDELASPPVPPVLPT